MDGHKVEGCQGKWIDVGTLRDPWKQICAGCRASRQKPADGYEPDEPTLSLAEDRHVRGLRRLQEDLEENDPVHQDENGFWFWDEALTERHGPYDTEQLCRDALDEYARGHDIEPGNHSLRWLVVSVALGVAFLLGWVARGL